MTLNNNWVPEGTFYGNHSFEAERRHLESHEKRRSHAHHA